MNQLPAYLQTRVSDRRISKLRDQDCAHIIITSADDTGVMLNGGRLGSRLGPKAILTSFHQMIAPAHAQDHQVIALCPHLRRAKNLFQTEFESYQNQQIQVLASLFKPSWTKIVHLGGGHDHIYPLLCAYEQYKKKPLLIINLDAHLDTRVDHQSHSGTPFRQFSHHSKMPFKLLQVGIHAFSNAQANHQPLHQGEMNIIDPEQILSTLDLELQSDYEVVLSLDADAMDANIMEAVSAVNPQGLKLDLIDQVIKLINARRENYAFGIYEYNPLYDNLSQKGARVLANLMDKVLL
jgi:formiminoglutamase